MGHHISAQICLMLNCIQSVKTFCLKHQCLSNKCPPIATVHCLTINNATMHFCNRNIRDKYYRESIDFQQDQQGNLAEMSELRRDHPVVWYPVTKLDQFLAMRQPLFSKVWLLVENKVFEFLWQFLFGWLLYFPTTNSNAVHSSHRQWIQQFGYKWKWTWKNWVALVYYILPTICSGPLCGVWHEHRLLENLQKGEKYFW